MNFKTRKNLKLNLTCHLHELSRLRWSSFLVFWVKTCCVATQFQGKLELNAAPPHTTTHQSMRIRKCHHSLHLPDALVGKWLTFGFLCLPSTIFTSVLFKFSAFSVRTGGRQSATWTVSLIRAVLANTSLTGSIVQTLLLWHWEIFNVSLPLNSPHHGGFKMSLCAVALASGGNGTMEMKCSWEGFCWEDIYLNYGSDILWRPSDPAPYWDDTRCWVWRPAGVCKVTSTNQAYQNSHSNVENVFVCFVCFLHGTFNKVSTSKQQKLLFHYSTRMISEFVFSQVMNLNLLLIAAAPCWQGRYLSSLPSEYLPVPLLSISWGGKKTYWMPLNKDVPQTVGPDAAQIKQSFHRWVGEEAVKPPPIRGIIDLQRWMNRSSCSAAAAVIDVINNKELDCVTRRRVA